DEALVERLVSQQTVAEAACRAHGRRGASRLAAALDRHTVTQDTRSRAEKRLRDLVRAAELPEPQMNVYVQGCLVDAYWPAQRLVVEFDSAKYHANLPVFEHDRAKGNK